MIGGGVHRTRPIVVDLFSGAGGLSLGFEQAGFDVVLAVESEALHAAVYEYNFPLTPVLNIDVATLKKEQLLLKIEEGMRRHGGDVGAWDGEVDAVVGGPPCQGFSFIGKRDAQERRNKLVYAFAAVVKMLRPKYFVMENVPGMKVGEQKKTLKRLIRKFDDAGYKIVCGDPQTVNAADFGVPQDRERLFIVGARGRVALPSPLEPRDTKVNVYDAIGDLPEIDLYPTLIEDDQVILSAVDLARQAYLASSYARKMMRVEIDVNDFSIPRRHDLALLTCSLRTVHNSQVQSRFAATPQDGIERVSRFHKLPYNGRANTIRAGTGPDHGSHTSARPIHPEKPRVITAREAARLQSFPDWFRFHRTRWHAFRQIGNAVPPLLAQAVAKTILDALGVNPYRPTKSIPLGDLNLLSFSPKEAVAYFKAQRDRLSSVANARISA